MNEPSAPTPPSFPALIQQFFTECLVAQRAVSPRTVACCRDALSLLLGFASHKLGKAPTAMRLADRRPELILAFLDHLEQSRKNMVRSRNLRLTALRAFLKFAARRDVTALHDFERALAVPMKRFERPVLGFLTRPEMLAVLGPPGETWSSKRDHLMLALLYNTGARVSEMIGVRSVDVILDGGACVHLHGKGRKLRSIPLWKSTEVELRAWLRLSPMLRGSAALLPNQDGQAMCRSNVTQRLSLAVARATAEQPSLSNKRVSLQTLRHTSTMQLLQSGVPFSVIALWLGHENTDSSVCRGRPDDEGEGTRTAGGARHQDRPLQGTGFAAAVPANTVTMRRIAGLNGFSLQGPAPAISRHLCIAEPCAQGSRADESRTGGVDGVLSSAAGSRFTFCDGQARRDR